MLLFAFTGIVRAQNIVKSLERYVPGQGKVTIHQDPRIEALLGTEYVATGEQTILKSPGYRVQVYAGNNSRTARNEATNMASKVKEYLMRKLRATGVFKEVSIVKDQINIPL